MLSAPAQAIRLGSVIDTVVKANPAEHLVGLALDPEEYDPATRCTSFKRSGVTRMLRWLDTHAAGESWGVFRCEKWGPGSASLHAEGRAIDWHLDVADPASKRAGVALIRMLLAPDSSGEPHALARRMGVQELIWDCSYWSAGQQDFGKYPECFNKHGVRRKRVNRTAAHLDHIHIGMSKAGAAGRTSFWTAGR